MRKLGGTKRILKEGVVHDGLAKPLVPSPHHSLVKEEVVDMDNFPSIESMPLEYIFSWKLVPCEDPWSRVLSKIFISQKVV